MMAALRAVKPDATIAAAAHCRRARVLIVKLSSLGDVVHAMPVVQDIPRRPSRTR